MFSYTYEDSSEQTPKLTKAWEHSIILDLRKSSDKKLAESLRLSTYTCSPLRAKTLIECSIKNNTWQSLEKPEFVKNKLMTNLLINGDSLKVYTNKDGSAHLEVFDSEKGLHHLYTFTSTTNLERYSELYHNEIVPKKLNSAPFNLF